MLAVSLSSAGISSTCLQSGWLGVLFALSFSLVTFLLVCAFTSCVISQSVAFSLSLKFVSLVGSIINLVLNGIPLL